MSRVSHALRTHGRTARMIALLLLCVTCAGCAVDASAAPARTPAPSPSATPATRAVVSPTAIADCAQLIQGPPYIIQDFPLPPNTVSSYPNGASGGSVFFECTPGATPASITTYLNTALPQAGWQRWDPTTETAYCGIEANTFWLWTKGGAKGDAVGWSVQGSGGLVDPPLPLWTLASCSLAFGR